MRGREALPAQPENPFSARSGRGVGCTNGTEDGTDVKVTYELKEQCNSVVRKNNPFMQA